MNSIKNTASLPINENGIQLFLVPDLIGWFAARKELERIGLNFIPSRFQPSRGSNVVKVDWSIKQFALTGLDEWNREARVCADWYCEDEY